MTEVTPKKKNIIIRKNPDDSSQMVEVQAEDAENIFMPEKIAAMALEFIVDHGSSMQLYKGEMQKLFKWLRSNEAIENVFTRSDNLTHDFILAPVKNGYDSDLSRAAYRLTEDINLVFYENNIPIRVTTTVGSTLRAISHGYSLIEFGEDE